MPDDVLRERPVSIEVHIGLAYADAPNAAFQRRINYLHPVSARVASDVHGETSGMCAVAAPLLAPFIGHTAVGATEHKRYARRLAYLVKLNKETLVHIRDAARGHAPREFRWGEILAHNSQFIV